MKGISLLLAVALAPLSPNPLPPSTTFSDSSTIIQSENREIEDEGSADLESAGTILIPLITSPISNREDQISTLSSAMIPSIDGTYTVPNYPRVSRAEGCRRAQAGKMIFTVAWNGLVCFPLSLAGGPVGSFMIGWACGYVGERIINYPSSHQICK
ncbi:MAG: hypothetical protein SPG34_00245 [Trueperella sp.]|uniref:hypothetical protein n=1 Tax=Trueperella sp. TaxID=2699835 RepID=UPI002A91115F|nr:hypothetical protein [Trueperella sp.]MDY5402756.1 hypothetical protein [Trueperella sp.]